MLYRSLHMRPVDLQQIGQELAIKWEDGEEQFISLEKLRKSCPCAACQGETDIMGNLYKGAPQTLSPSSFQLMRLVNVGTYAVQPIWGDGHASGLFTFDLLKKLG